MATKTHAHLPAEHLSKATLADHIGDWHGRYRCVTRWSELIRWTKEELENTHAELHAAMEQEANA